MTAFDPGGVLSGLDPERVREMRLAEAREAREQRAREAADEAAAEARIARATRDGRPHGLDEVLATQAVAEAAQARRDAKEAEKRAQAREAAAQANYWQRKAAGLPVGHEEILARYAAAADGPTIPAPGPKPPPTPEQKMLTQHELDVTQGKAETGKLRDALTKLKGRLSGQGVDPLGRRKY